MAETGKPKWTFYPGWVLFSAVALPLAWVLAWVVILLVEWIVGETLRVGGQTAITEDRVMSYVLLPMAGLITGFLQELLLRRVLPRIGWWVGASVASYVVPFGLAALLPPGAGRVPGSDPRVSGMLGFAALGGLMGLCQWAVLRRHVRHAGWWVLAMAVGWAAAGYVTGGMVADVGSIVAIALLPPVAASFAMWLLLDVAVASAEPAPSRAADRPLSES